MIINGATGQIICVHQAKGSVHDMELFRQSEVRFNRFILVVGDKGYQGICELHENSLTPYKKPKGGELTLEQKIFNSKLSTPHETQSQLRMKIGWCKGLVKVIQYYSGS